MNRRKQGSKYVFEPKILVEEGILEEDGAEKMPAFLTSQRLKGEYPPRPLESSMLGRKLDVGAQSGCLFLLPDELERAKLVVFEDGSVGLKIGSKVCPGSFCYIGSALAVEGLATDIGEAEFLISHLDES
jgi:hypothetical protein